MEHVRWLRADKPNPRRTVVDAIEVLTSEAGLGERDHATIRAKSMLLPSRQTVSLVALSFKPLRDLLFIVSLPTSATVSAICIDTEETIQITAEDLDNADVSFQGVVTLARGGRLRAVKVNPALMPYDLSSLDWRILQETIKLLGIERKVYRSAWKGLSRCECKCLPPWKAIDFHALGKQRFDLNDLRLKEIRGTISDRFPRDKAPSERKIAQTLQKVGMRFAVRRPRRQANARPN